MGRKTKRILPLGMFETFEYDEMDRLVSHTDFNGNTIKYEYDVNGRVVKKNLKTVLRRYIPIQSQECMKLYRT